MTEREAPPDSGFDFWQDDPYDDGWLGPEQAVQTTNTWTVNGRLCAPSDSPRTSRSSLPWYRTKAAAVALVVAASAAVAAPIVLLASRTVPPAGPAQPTTVLPQASTSAEPTPGSAGTPITVLSPPPPAPPPAPSSTEDTATADTPRWSRATREPTQKPTTGAPTPITRAPISVAPAPRQPPTTATPGTGHPRWGW